MGTLFDNLKDLDLLLSQNDGKFLVFENDKPKLVILDAGKFPQMISDSKGKILVTGGAGYIGSMAVKKLIEHGYTVLVLDNLSSGHSESVSGAELVVGDLGDVTMLNRVFEANKIDAVLHFAGFIRVDESVKLPAKYFQNNVINGLNLVNAMVKHGVNKIVYSSSAAVYGNPTYTPIDENHACVPTNPYGESKLIFEKILNWYGKSHGISAVMFRYFNAAGAAIDGTHGENHPVETHLIPKILDVAAQKEPTLKIFGFDYPTYDGTAIRDYVHIEDLAEAHVLALDKLKKDQGTFAYNIGTGHGRSICEVVDAVMEVTSRMVAVERMPRREGDPAILVADNKKILKDFNFELKHSDLETIIKTAWEWHKKLATSK